MTTPESASTPRPDPTSLTTDALQREIGQLRELLESKMDALDTKMTGHFLLDADRFSAIAEFAVIGMVVTIGLALLTVVGFVLANAP